MNTVFIALGLLVGAWWFAGLRCLPTAAAGFHTGPGTVSVVVPARDEAAQLPTLLESLRSSGAAVREVIVVDDASTDATAAVAEAHGATVLRLEGEPPPGWTGKAHACARGASVATGTMLLFLDADVTVAPGGVDRLLDAQARHGGLISVQPHHRIERSYESLSATCNVMAIVGTGLFAVWPRTRKPIAYGPCLMTAADDYRAVGGHAAVKGEVIEDVHLARRYADHGLPVHAFGGGDVLSFRMYPGGVGQLIDGWTKSLAPGAGLVSPVAVVAAAWWLTACLAIGLRGIGAVLQPGSLELGDAVVVLAGWIAVTLELRWMLRRIGSFGWSTAIFHPVPMCAFVALFGRSLWLTLVRGRVRWRGRDIAV
ncbi:MAG: glycosyltransferase [Actinobacteria bacterium]|nr:glycosyltransferase [Actinomycetota bacterium]